MTRGYSSSYTGSSALRAVVIATTIAGTLYILAAFGFATLAGGSPVGVLRGIAGAIVDTDQFSNALGPVVIGLTLHGAIATVMTTCYITAATRLPFLNRAPVLSGIGYGVALWLVMFWVVLPQRWPTMFPTTAPADIAMQLGCHILLVGIPIALVARAATRWRYEMPFSVFVAINPQ